MLHLAPIQRGRGEGPMETQGIDARFDVLEGKLEAQGQAAAEHFVEMQNFVVHHVTRLRNDMNTGFARIDERFSQIDERFSQIDGRFGQIDGRLKRVERRLDRHEELLGEILVEVRSLKRD